MKTLFRLFKYAPPLWPIAIRYLILVLFGVLFSILNFSLLIPVLDLIFNTGTAAQSPIVIPEFSFSFEYIKAVFYHFMGELQVTKGPMSALIFTCIVVLVSVLLANVFKYTAQRTITRMQSFIIRNLRQDLFDKLMSLDIGFFRKTKKGHLLSVASNDINEIQMVAGSSLQVILRDPLFILAYAAVLFYYSPQLTLFALLVLPISGLIISGLARLLKRNAKQSQTLLSSLLGLLEEAVSGIRIIKIFNAEKYINKKFDEQNNAQRVVFKKMWNRSDIASPLSEVLGIAAVAFIVLYGGNLIINGSGSLTGSEFIAYIVIFSQILNPAKSLASATANFQRGLASAERVFAILDTETEIKETPDAKVLTSFEKSIVIKDVSFAYNVDLILNGINLEIKKGETVALVGQSGSGKTTLVNLIPRFYDVKEGAILIDGVDIRDCGLHSLYNQMSMVTQEPILFNDTVYNNIVFGLENVTEEEVINAARVANAHEFIMHTEDGYQTIIGDGGNRLSGGQKQRLSIARAVLKNPPILILDEATSALDTESERLVQDALTNLMKNRTSIVIAHRLSTIQYADKIVVMDKGQIVETGNHAALIAMNGIYKRLCDLQTFE